MDKKTFFASIFLALLFSMQSVLAVSDTATVYVNVQEVAEITVVPNVLSWNVLPGNAGGTKLLDVKNTGSKNVSQIYAYVDTLEDEATRPYGSPNANSYAAGGVIVFKNETYNKYFFAGRIEWNWTEDISNMQKGGVVSPVAWGFFKNTSYEYNWLVGNGTGGYCNNTAAQFAIEDDVDNGTAETRTPVTTNINCNQADVNYTYCSINRATSSLYESCVAIYKDCTKIYIYRYDKRSSPNFGLCGNARYLQEPNLMPSETHTLTLNIYTPLGIPFGSLNTSTFTVHATG